MIHNLSYNLGHSTTISATENDQRRSNIESDHEASDSSTGSSVQRDVVPVDPEPIEQQPMINVVPNIPVKPTKIEMNDDVSESPLDERSIDSSIVDNEVSMDNKDTTSDVAEISVEKEVSETKKRKSLFSVVILPKDLTNQFFALAGIPLFLCKIFF